MCWVPLAIRTIASLLRTKASENELRSFKSYELSKITQEEENDISSTIKFVRLNLINHVLALFRDKFACNIALRNLVFRWKSCKGSV